MSRRRRIPALVGFLAVLLLAAPAAQAAWIASGSFKYQDREFDEEGFTGATPLLPVRFAKVEVRYLKGGGSTLLASGATDAAGNYAITVNDTSTRDIFIRVLTVAGAPDLFLQVTNFNGPTASYAVTTPTFTAHAPVNLNAGSVTAAIGSGGEPFNLFDVGVNTMDYLAYLNGSRPGSSQQLTLQWEAAGGVISSSYLGGDVIRVADNSGYNDTVIQHESGHYAVDNFSASDSPGGVHHLTNCRQDLRLAFDEGFATFFGQAVRRHLNLPRPNLYVKTTGAAGAGNLDFYFDVEAEVPFTCSASTSEVTVYATLWDIGDDLNTPDGTPGQEESWDTVSVADSVVWDVMRNYIPGALNKSVEDFWDGWFIRGEGVGSSMRSLFGHHGMEFYPDGGEENDSPASAESVPANGVPVHASYFKDRGDGSGTTDIDYFKFDAVGGLPYRIETVRLVGDPNTALVLLGTDGVTAIASNDDRSPSDKSSLIQFTAPVTGSYFIMSYHGAGLGMYGSYDLAVTGNPQVGGADPPATVIAPTTYRVRTTTDGQSPSGSSFQVTAPD